MEQQELTQCYICQLTYAKRTMLQPRKQLNLHKCRRCNRVERVVNEPFDVCFSTREYVRNHPFVK